jgi:hypothetical protein
MVSGQTWPSIALTALNASRGIDCDAASSTSVCAFCKHLARQASVLIQVYLGNCSSAQPVEFGPVYLTGTAGCNSAEYWGQWDCVSSHTQVKLSSSHSNMIFMRAVHAIHATIHATIHLTWATEQLPLGYTRAWL